MPATQKCWTWRTLLGAGLALDPTLCIDVLLASAVGVFCAAVVGVHRKGKATVLKRMTLLLFNAGSSGNSSLTRMGADVPVSLLESQDGPRPLSFHRHDVKRSGACHAL